MIQYTSFSVSLMYVSCIRFSSILYTRRVPNDMHIGTLKTQLNEVKETFSINVDTKRISKEKNFLNFPGNYNFYYRNRLSNLSVSVITTKVSIYCPQTIQSVE